GAIARRYKVGEAAVATFAAGTDVAMLCHDVTQIAPAMEATTEAINNGRLSPEEWKASGDRINRILNILRNPRPATLDAIGCATHRALATEIKSRIPRA
ncbi:MAG: hypothetical protein ACRD5L_10455, partial [Bryobacteraceae bacterium]